MNKTKVPLDPLKKVLRKTLGETWDVKWQLQEEGGARLPVTDELVVTRVVGADVQLGELP